MQDENDVLSSQVDQLCGLLKQTNETVPSYCEDDPTSLSNVDNTEVSTLIILSVVTGTLLLGLGAYKYMKSDHSQDRADN